MSLDSSDYLLKPERSSADLQSVSWIIYRISIIIVLALSMLDLIGWVFNLPILKSIGLEWTPMKIITAIFFILSAVSVIIINQGLFTLFRKSIIYIIASIICIISLLTMYVYLSVLKNVHDPALTGVPYFKFFLPLEMRMAFLTSFNFFIISFVLFLLARGLKKNSWLVNVLIVPLLLASYFVLLSYILGANSIKGFGNFPVALNTALAFCAICVTFLIINPDSWILKVFTSGETGYLTARKLLPTLLFLPAAVGWIRIKGERIGWFESDEGVIIVAITYTISFLVLVWLTSRSLNLIDRRRMHADEELRKSNKELEQQVQERILAEKQLLKSKEKLDLALENGQIGTWEWDLRTDNFEWDNRTGRMFSLNHDPVPVKFNDFENFIHEEDVSHFHRAVQNSLDQSIPLDIVFRTRPGENGYNYISVKALVEKDSKSKVVKMAGVCFDITEMKKGAEKVLFYLNEDLVRSNRELEQFAYVASHDLQEPLRMISSFTQLLAHRYKDKLDSDANEFIQYAVDGATRMQTLINDLLEYSRVETRGKKPVIMDMNNLLGLVMNNLSIKIKEKNALITNDELPVVTADGGQMLQLFQNLIGNAIKFSDNSPIIHISSKEEADLWVFSVKDNGIGIEPQYFNKIFQIFQRLHTREQYGGTGIGLAICQRIVERHGGKIWLESIPGHGTTFYFTLIKNK